MQNEFFKISQRISTVKIRIYGSQNDWFETYLKCRPMFCLQRVDFRSLEFEVRMVISQQKVQLPSSVPVGQFSASPIEN